MFYLEMFIMSRRKFNKQFKNAAVKFILEEGYSVKKSVKSLEFMPIVFIAGLKKLKNMAKILFQAMGQP